MSRAEGGERRIPKLEIKLLGRFEVLRDAKPIPEEAWGRQKTKTLLKVLKGLAEYCDISLGDLLEGIVLHAFEGKAPFSAETQAAIRDLKKVYGCELSAADSHQLTETGS